jgi:hypothetical protein
MTPKEILSKHILGIAGIRIPFAKIIIENVIHELKDHGYIIIEERTLRTLPKKEN